MVALKNSQMRIIDDIFGMQGGYVLNFSDRTMAEFFDDEIGINIYQEKYGFNGTSKAKHIRAFIAVEDAYTVGKLLRKLWEHKKSYWDTMEDLTPQENRLFDLIQRIEAGQSAPVSSLLSDAATILNFDTVSRDIQRALDAANSDPESAVTSACATVESVCRSILVELAQELPNKKDIQSLFNAVKRPLGLSPDRDDINELILKDVQKILVGLGTTVEGIGALRTHAGTAHGREKGYVRIDSRIARLAINSASTVALFLIETWQKKFPAKELLNHSE